MSRLRLAAVMVRYRVASLLLPFFLLAPALHGQLREFRLSYVAGLMSLCACYLVATCLNDVFDVEIDRINHSGATDRPLVSGAARPRDLLVIATAASAFALIAAFEVGPLAAGVVAFSLLLNVLYSVPPVRLTRRPIAAPVMLAFAYVVLPYACGLAAAGLAPTLLDLLAVASFMILFAGRMLLKDFRDRLGDAAFDKRTFLLTYGRRATVLLAGACVVAGDLVLVWLLRSNIVLTAIVQTYFVAIGWQLTRLWSATTLGDEKTAIAFGARMGNAVVLTILGSALLTGAGADVISQATFIVMLAAIYWFGLVYSVRLSQPQPQQGHQASFLG